MAQCAAHPAVLIILLVFGLAAVLLLTVPSEDIPVAPGFMYGIVLDAGSSHTSLFVYKWPADKQNGTGVVTQHSECHATGGGISSYAGQQGAVGQSLEVCLDQAVHDVPAHRHKVTPVYLGATAGMRLLRISSPHHSAQILQEVGRKIQSYPFSYQGATILSGQEEGAYGWVTVNYLLENFIKYGFVGQWLSSERPTVGALDFGGASTQITFVTREQVEDEKDMMKLRLYGQEYSLYTHSFLCYGQDQVLKRLLAHIFKSQGHSVSVTHPCHPPDSSVKVNLDSIFNSPCTAKYKPSTYQAQDYLLIHGSGQYEQCVGNVSEIFSFDSCPFSHCSFDNISQPNVTGSFMAFSAFFYIHAFLRRITGITVSTPAQMEEAAQTVCKMSFAQMLALAPDQASRLRDYCASSVFVKILLLKGYSFDEKSFSRISFKKKAGDASVGWALGYMLSLSNLLPSEKVRTWKALAPGIWESLTVLFVLLSVTVLVFIALRAPVKLCVDMCTQTKAAARMVNIPQADIDPSGVFKYVLIRVHSKEIGDDTEVDIVRGYGWAEYHADIYEKVSEELERDGLLDCECVGGGRIRHDAQAKKIHVYGYSMGFGRANHAIATEKLKVRYPDYEVTWDNEGY